MKKCCFLFCFIFLCFYSNAQMRLGVKAGYNNSTGIYDGSNNIRESKSINGLQVGIFAEKTIIGSLKLNSNLLFTQKGNYVDYTSKTTPQDHYDVRTYRLNYLEGDIAVSYKINTGRKSGVKLGIGPYVAFGLSGKETGSFNWFGNKGDISRKVKFSNKKATVFNQTNFSPFEWGLNFKGSFVYKKYMLYVNYGRGLGSRVLRKYAGNTSGNEFGDYESDTKNSVISLGLGYYLR